MGICFPSSVYVDAFHTDSAEAFNYLEYNLTYDTKLALQRARTSPTRNFSREILASSTLSSEYQVFYEFSPNFPGQFTYRYNDKNGNPIGIEGTLEVGMPDGIVSGDTTMYDCKVTIRRHPNKFAEGVKEGNITNEGKLELH